MERISSKSSDLEPSLDNSNAELYRRELIKIRHQLDSANGEIKSLRNEVRQLEEQKYNAYKRIAELNSKK